MKARTQNRRVQANVEFLENWTVIWAGRALRSGIIDYSRLRLLAEWVCLKKLF